MPADKKVAAPPMVMLNPRQYAAQQLAAEIEEQKAAGVKLDETQPGGYFLGTDGKPHDAEGKPVKEVKSAKKGAAAGASDEDEPLPTVADLEDALEGMDSDEIRAMQERDERVSAQPIYARALGEEE